MEEKKIINDLENISKSTKIADEDGNGFYRIFWDDKVEKVNPVEYYKNYELNKRAISFRDILEMKDPFLAGKLTTDFYVKLAKEEIEKEKFWETKEEIEVPENFLKLLETTRKKDQVSLLKGLSINPDQLISLIFKSFNDHHYLYSRYRFENLPKDLDDKKRPKVADISKEGVIKTVGETELTEGQVKKMINERKVIIAHFFDRGDDWHCLFITYNSIDGRENHKNGQPHFHYISSAFGITRDDFIKSMENGNYKSTPIHIDLLEYGNQPTANDDNNEK
ncbi:hypothetical protein [Parabacteroides merdae]|mgnify:CR=1 FL=1|jgi:hypothetical protein|uniref:Uncharacterized protein n=1 Tax=Parabacteroides merdae TaxID=46503 RepID=A0AA43W0P2_9BACT|nr:hypothetical protein [Parabacteroides merdae]DAO47680.1 MAG TPA: hypothetical protein [Herelleviridae sp.]MTT25224.1 hypothetical protein [Parabacteroides merdae]MTU61560.1 hypothetical protein [Parabacteroides merdae]MTU64739.1 hypothetical protein [Parabacteroides merdae]MTU68010.1 hypothetical protein [Parabacteroides merdae]